MSLFTRLRSNIDVTLSIAFGLAAVGMSTIIFYMPQFAPVAYTRFVTEDQWGEYATSIAFAFCAVLSFRVAFKSADRRHKLAWIIFGLGAVYVAGEEISWGQRLFGLTTPGFLQEMNRQGELTIHNLYIFDSDPLHLAIVFMIGGWLIASLCLAMVPDRLRNRVLGLGFIAIPIALFPIFLLPIFFWTQRPVPRASEVAELFLGLSTAALAIDQYLRMKRPGQARGASAVGIYAALLLLLLVISLSLPQVTGSAQRNWRGPLHNSASYVYPRLQMFDQAEEVFEYIYANPRYVRKYTRIRHGRILLDAGKPAEAGEILSQALSALEEAESKSPEDWLYIGVAHSLLGRKAEAIHALDRSNEAYQEQSVSRQPENEVARKSWWKARTKMAAGDREGALQIARSARDEATSIAFWRDLDKWIEIAQSSDFYVSSRFQHWIEFANRDL